MEKKVRNNKMERITSNVQTKSKM